MLFACFISGTFGPRDGDIDSSFQFVRERSNGSQSQIHVSLNHLFYTRFHSTAPLPRNSTTLTMRENAKVQGVRNSAMKLFFTMLSTALDQLRQRMTYAGIRPAGHFRPI